MKNLDLNLSAVAGAQMMNVPGAWQQFLCPYVEESHPVICKWLICSLGLQSARRHASIHNTKRASGGKAQGQSLQQICTHTAPHLIQAQSFTQGFSIPTGFLVILDTGVCRGLADPMCRKAYLVLRQEAALDFKGIRV